MGERTPNDDVIGRLEQAAYSRLCHDSAHVPPADMPEPDRTVYALVSPVVGYDYAGPVVPQLGVLADWLADAGDYRRERKVRTRISPASLDKAAARLTRPGAVYGPATDKVVDFDVTRQVLRLFPRVASAMQTRLAADTVARYVRLKMREDGIYRRVMAPNVVPDDRSDRTWREDVRIAFYDGPVVIPDNRIHVDEVRIEFTTADEFDLVDGVPVRRPAAAPPGGAP